MPRSAPYVPKTAAVTVRDVVSEPFADRLAELLILGTTAAGKARQRSGIVGKPILYGLIYILLYAHM